MLLLTPSKYPISVEVTALAVIAPVPLVISALSAVVVPSFVRSIAATALTSEFVIARESFDCAIAAVPLMSALTRVVASSRNLIQLPP